MTGILIVPEIPLTAQAPETMSFQAILRNADGSLAVNVLAGIRVSILEGSSSGIEVFAETHQAPINSQGRLSLQIGNGTAELNSFSSINWSAGPYFLKTETDPGGGINYSIQSVTQVLGVPYALHAAITDSLINPITESDPIFQSSAASGITSADTTSWNTKIHSVVAGEGIELTGNTVSAPQAHWVGESFGGGIIVALWKTSGVQHGLIAANSYVGQAQYSNITNIFVGSSAWNGVNGQENTAAIIAQPGHYLSAASMCSQYNSGGYTDWYLPSLLELKHYMQNRFILEKAGIPIYSTYYWTSTEDSTGDTGEFGFTIQTLSNYSGTTAGISKFNMAIVVPMRRF